VARPRKTVDPTKLRDLALIGCSIETMARNLSVSRDTLERRYRTVIEEGRGEAEVQLHAKQHQAAMRGTRWALELSLINRCGWSNRPETVINVTQTTGQPVAFNAAEFKARFAAAQKYLQEHQDELQRPSGNGERIP
jgi:DNA-binding transcriptional MocR family regulator